MPPSTIDRLWLHDTWASRSLLPASWAYRAVLALRAMLYRHAWLRPQRLPVPVVVVGNFFVGGTGKTPLVIALVEQLRARGWSPGVVSRGYGARGAAPHLVGTHDTATIAGDEPLLIARRTGVPVCIGRDRPAAARHLLAAHPAVDLVLCDDGLQHLALARDFEIAVFDRRGTGNGRVLPAGPLREPVRTTDAVVRNGIAAAASEFAMDLVVSRLYPIDQPELTIPVTTLATRRVVALAGIGDPSRFFGTVRMLGITPIREIALPDHHPIVAADLVHPDADVVLVTEKDAVKCHGLGRPGLVHVLGVDARLDPRLPARIDEHLRR